MDYIITCRVVMCLSLNLFSQYLRTTDVLPTHPSPSRTTLKEDDLPPPDAILTLTSSVSPNPN